MFKKLIIAGLFIIVSAVNVYSQTPALTPFGIAWDQNYGPLNNAIPTNAVLQINGVQAAPVPWANVITQTSCGVNCFVALFRHNGLPAGNHSFEIVVGNSGGMNNSGNLVHNFVAVPPPVIPPNQPINLRIVTQGQIVVNPDGSVTIIINP
jgi:hypothetical protein